MHAGIAAMLAVQLDIAERRRPQDGGFRVRIDRDEEQVNVDIRVSVVPSSFQQDAPSSW